MSATQQGCINKEVTITQADLPLSCPVNNERVWDGHPRVYLSFGKESSVQCPYCGTIYHLKQED